MNNNTIVLKSKGHHEEGTATAAIKPGQPLEYLAGDKQYGIASDDATSFLVAKEDALQGRTVRDAYAAEERVFAYQPLPGDVILGVVPVGTAVTEGAAVGIAGGEFVTDAGVVIGKFYETLNDGAATTEEELVPIRIS